MRSRRSGERRCTAGMLVFVDGMLVSSPGAIGGSRQRTPAEDSLALRRPRAGGTTLGGMLGGGGRAGRRGSGAAAGQPFGADPIPSIDATATVNTSSLFDVNQIALSTVAGVEVYPTLAGIPPEFRLPGAECGVVLIWTAGRLDGRLRTADCGHEPTADCGLRTHTLATLLVG